MFLYQAVRKYFDNRQTAAKMNPTKQSVRGSYASTLHAQQATEDVLLGLNDWAVDSHSSSSTDETEAYERKLQLSERKRSTSAPSLEISMVRQHSLNRKDNQSKSRRKVPNYDQREDTHGYDTFTVILLIWIHILLCMYVCVYVYICGFNFSSLLYISLYLHELQSLHKLIAAVSKGVTLFDKCAGLLRTIEDRRKHSKHAEWYMRVYWMYGLQTFFCTFDNRSSTTEGKIRKCALICCADVHYVCCMGWYQLGFRWLASYFLQYLLLHTPLW